ncbi:L,D-transpeptidase [Maritalea porphyrae]|uniref:L,D-transpeptidase n=1 Tax=Maritalea porphyrae TaxID=880732 RepID=UPI0022AEE37B|nr:L,D-transpeptidase [Maritalea porphyrae]MCZ4271622.1 L,D-transpeptidase [Maritalea porphyrae]
MIKPFNRRQFLMLGASAAAAPLLAACGTAGTAQLRAASFREQARADLMRYAAIEDGEFTIPAIPGNRIDRQFWRQVVDDPFGELPGTLVVDTPNRFLYLTLQDKQALRVGIGVGKQGFTWSGRATIQMKRRWPTWTPPREMIERVPELEKWAKGQPPGLENPLGARALYIYQGGRDTLYRVHGSPEWWTIGTAASSGCIRLTNHDIVDLFERVPNGSPILVIPDNRFSLDTLA